MDLVHYTMIVGILDGCDICVISRREGAADGDLILGGKMGRLVMDQEVCEKHCAWRYANNIAELFHCPTHSCHFELNRPIPRCGRCEGFAQEEDWLDLRCCEWICLRDRALRRRPIAPLPHSREVSTSM